MPVRKRKRKKTRYRKITFKLTVKQSKSLENCCRARKTTPTRLIKKSIGRYINNYDVEVPDQYFVSEKQLDLFMEETGSGFLRE